MDKTNPTLPFSISKLATSLSLQSAYDFSFPGDTQPSAFDYLRYHWNLWNNRLYGGTTSSVSFVKDPFPTLQAIQRKGQVLSVAYPKGSYRQSQAGAYGGTTFYPSPLLLEGKNKAMLTYQVAFDPTFDFVKGGKLPGFWSGNQAQDCSGGKESDGSCWSIRLMWRTGGMGEGASFIIWPEVFN